MTARSIILNDITCIDAAEIWLDTNDPNYVVIDGVSKMVSVEIYGKVDKHEQVILDFSNIKKNLKSFIDDPIWGFDHKLLMNFDDFSKENVEFEAEGIDADGNISTRKRDLLRIVEPTTGRVVFQLKGKDFIRPYSGILENALSEYLADRVRQFYGDSDIQLQVHLSGKAVQSHDGKYRSYFSYTHGLRNSTSWGCQNMLHGHTSYVQAINDKDEVDKHVSDLIATYLDGSYLYHEDIVKDILGKEDEPKSLKFRDIINGLSYKLKYKSRERGKWTMILPAAMCVPLDNEPTIENIVAHVAEFFKNDLNNAGIVKLVISEGLTKAGAVCLY